MQSRSIRRSGQPTSASASRMRAFDRDLIRGRHYGQRSCEPHKQAEHMAAPTNLQREILLANPGPSTHGTDCPSRMSAFTESPGGYADLRAWLEASKVVRLATYLLSRSVDRRPRRDLPMAKYVPSPRDWVREQVELYEKSGGTKGTTLRDTGLPVVLVTHWGNKTGAIRKTPLMRVNDGDNYILVGSQGGAPKDPAWVHNLRVNPHIELRDETIVRPM